MLKKSYSYIKVALFLGVIFLIPSIFICSFYEKDIVDKALGSINSLIAGEIRYEQAEVNFLKNFPNIDAVLLQPQLALQGDTLLQGEKMAIQLDILSMIQGSYKIHGIDLNQSIVRITRGTDHSLNLSDFFDTDDEKSESGGTDLTISKINLHQVDIIYYDSLSYDQVEITQADGQIDCRLSDQELSSQINLERGKIKKIIIGDKRYSTGQSIVARGKLKYSLDQKQAHFSPGFKLSLGKAHMNVAGDIAFHKNTSYNLKLNSFRTDLKNLYYQIPREYQQLFSKYEISGEFNGSVSVEGKSTKERLPRIQVNGNLKVPVLAQRDGTKILGGIKTKINLKAGPDIAGKKFMVHFNEFSARSEYGVFSGNIQYSDLTRGVISAQLSGEGELTALNATMPKHIHIKNGRALISNLTINDWIQNSNEPLLERIELEGEIQNAHWSYNQLDVKSDIEHLSISAGELVANNLSTELAKSDFTGDLSVRIKGNTYSVTSDLQSQLLDVNHLLEGIKSNESKAVSTTFPSSRLNLELNCKHSIDNLLYENISYEQTHIHYQETQKQFHLTGTTSIAHGSAQFESNGHRKSGINAQSKIVLTDIDVKKLFENYKNFDQDYITSAHLGGSMQAHLLADLSWRMDYTFNRSRAKIIGFVHAEDGQLNSFKPLEQFKKFIRLDLLSSVRFSDLNNYFSYENDELFIPSMFIQNNACNFYVSGFYNQSGRIHYNLLVHGEQALMRKLGRKQEGILPSAQKGWLDLYYNIDGTTQEFNYKSDKNLVIRGFEYGQKIEQELHRRLTQAFGSLPQAQQSPEWFETQGAEDGLTPGTEGQIEYLRNF